MGKRKCMACNGTGDYDSDVSPICLICKGKGYIITDKLERLNIDIMPIWNGDKEEAIATAIVGIEDKINELVDHLNKMEFAAGRPLLDRLLEIDNYTGGTEIRKRDGKTYIGGVKEWLVDNGREK